MWLVASEEPGGTIQELISALEQAIYTRRPVLGDIMAKHGQKNLYAYTLDFLDVNSNATLDARRGAFLDIVHDTLVPKLGSTVAAEVRAQLHHKPLVSTIDHHAIIDHPFFVNANIVWALPYDTQKLKYIVVLSFASVSLNNASAFPRGLLLHGGIQWEWEMVKLPILPDKSKMRTVYGTPGYTGEDINKTFALIERKKTDWIFSPERAAHISSFVRDYLATEDLYNTPDLSTQITKINYNLWDQYFVGSDTPKLIYLDVETLTAEVFLREVLHDTHHLHYKMLFDPTVRNMALECFDTIPGAFGIEEQWGTYFFRWLDAKGHRVRLFVKDNTLSSTDGAIVIDLTPDAVRKALQMKQIFPSMLAVYTLVSLYYGMKCLWGFSQVHDLTLMKSGLEELLSRLGDISEIDVIKPIQTKEFGGDGIILSYSQKQDGLLTPMTGIDMYLSDRKLSFADYRAISKQVSLSEMMLPMFPEIYTVLYTINQRDPKLSSLTMEEAMRVSGLQEKLHTLLGQYGLLHTTQEHKTLTNAAIETPYPISAWAPCKVGL